jgi:hypothetical protein
MSSPSSSKQLAIEVLKLEAMYLEAQKARSTGDFREEQGSYVRWS